MTLWVRLCLPTIKTKINDHFYSFNTLCSEQISLFIILVLHYNHLITTEQWQHVLLDQKIFRCFFNISLVFRTFFDKSHLDKKGIVSAAQWASVVTVVSNKMKILFFALLLVVSASAFRVKKVSPTSQTVKQGDSFKVICTTDSWYEVSDD